MNWIGDKRKKDIGRDDKRLKRMSLMKNIKVKKNLKQSKKLKIYIKEKLKDKYIRLIQTTIIITIQ